MKDHEGYYKAFTHTGEAWYADTALKGNVVDQIIIGYYLPRGGTGGEFSIEWIDLGLICKQPTPCLKAYDDGWDTLWCFRDLLEALAKLNDERTPPEQICELLISLGFRDNTVREDPGR